MSFANEKPVKAVRKRVACEGCSKHIEVGEPAVRWAGVTDGQFMACAFHPDCRDAELALNKLHRTGYDEWMSLADMEFDDHAWLLEKHPVVAERMGVTEASIKEGEDEREACRLAWAEIDRKRREGTKP